MKRLGWLGVLATAGLMACWGEEPAKAPVIARPDGGAAAGARTLPEIEAGVVAAPLLGPVPGETLEARAERVHRQAIIVDGHNVATSLLLTMLLVAWGEALGRFGPHGEIDRASEPGLVADHPHLPLVVGRSPRSPAPPLVALRAMQRTLGRAAGCRRPPKSQRRASRGTASS